MKLDVNQAVDTISLGEAVDDVGFMLCYATAHVAGYADVERSVSPACEDVEAGLHATMMARVIDSLDPRFRGGDELAAVVSTGRWARG
jgi:hypothetical protein